MLSVYFWMSLLSSEYVIMLACAYGNGFKISQPCSEEWGKLFCDVYWASKLLYWLWLIYYTILLFFMLIGVDWNDFQIIHFKLSDPLLATPLS